MFVEIVDIIRQRFAERGFTEVTVVEGQESRNAQANFGAGSANRVAFVPAKEPIAIIPPTFIGEGDLDEAGEARRQLWNMMFKYEVSFAGFDANNPERDLAHRRKCVDLFEVTTQEIQRAYHGAYGWSSATWADEKKHVRHGAELIATLTINVPIFDISSKAAIPGAVPGQPKPVEPFEAVEE